VTTHLHTNHPKSPTVAYFLGHRKSEARSEECPLGHAVKLDVWQDWISAMHVRTFKQTNCVGDVPDSETPVAFLTLWV
jgi:hypothetical protein